MRAFIAVSALIAIYLDPTEPTSYAGPCYAILAAYAAFSLVVVALDFFVPQRTPRWSTVLHCVDVCVAAVLTIFTEGPNSPFFVLFSFTSLAAAYRWGFFGALATSGLSIGLLFSEAILLGKSTHLSLGFVAGGFELNRLIVRAAYLVVLALLAGYLGENERRRRMEHLSIATILGNVRAASGLRVTLRTVLGTVLRLFAARYSLLVVRDQKTSRTFIWEVNPSAAGREDDVEHVELNEATAGDFLFDVGAHSWYGRAHRGGLFDIDRVDAAGVHMAPMALDLPRAFVDRYACRSVLCVSIAFGETWTGRVLLIDPIVGIDRSATIAFAQRLVAAIAPAAHEVYLLGRLRRRAAALERSRIARELHDGLVQSLIASELRVAALRRRVADSLPSIGDDLARVQSTIRDQVRTLRELIEGSQSFDGSRGTATDLRDVVERFRVETGIDARFVSRSAVSLSPRRNHEIVRIVQEGLVNVRRHSGAQHVLVRAGTQDRRYRVSIEDDGRGFPFEGRLTQDDLDITSGGPAVMIERVRALGGELSVISTPGNGARVDVDLPLAR